MKRASTARERLIFLECGAFPPHSKTVRNRLPGRCRRGSVERLDLDVTEVNLRAFGLQPNRPLGQFTRAGGDLSAVDLAGNHAVLARDLGRVPLADGMARLLESIRVELVAALGAHDGEDLAVLAVHALNLHALGPDFVLAHDVNEQAAVAGKLLVVF